jgi:hypothetical protein
MKATGCSPPEALREGPRYSIAELALCNVWNGGLASGRSKMYLQTPYTELV